MGLGELLKLDVYLSNGYLRATVLFVLLTLVLRLLLSLIQKVVLKVSSKTKTDIDDQIVAKSSTPLTLAAFLISLRIALEEITFSEFVTVNINRFVYSGLVIIVGYLLFVIVDIALISGWKGISKRTKVPLNESITNLVHSVLKGVVIILVFLYVLGFWGVEILPLLGALGIAGLAVALALQPTLANIFSGVSMVLDKSVRVGDWVVLDDGTWGTIDKIGIRSTRVKSFDNEIIIVPNTTMADNKIHNVSLPEEKVRAVVPFGVAYGSNIDKVKKLIEKEIKDMDHVLGDPAPKVRFLEMANSSLNFKVYFYVDSFQNRLNAIDEANTLIYNALNKAGISIPFPQMDVHLKK